MAHEDASPQVRKQAQFWMANKGGKKVSEDLRTIATNDPNEQIRKSAVFALSETSGDEDYCLGEIAVADSSKDPMVRRGRQSSGLDSPTTRELSITSPSCSSSVGRRLNRPRRVLSGAVCS